MTIACKENLLLEDTSCGRTLDEHLDSVSDLLPTGMAWPRHPDSTLMRYWRSFAEVVKYAEDRICALADEFFCDTASETLDVWYETYELDLIELPDVDPACLDPTYNLEDDRRARLCSEVTEIGGNQCDYYRDVAEGIHWIIDCADISDSTPPIVAGCGYAGCMQLGMTPEVNPAGSMLGCSTMAATYGGAVSYPDPGGWEYPGNPANSPAGVIPGSSLGDSALGDDCCNISGYFETGDPVAPGQRGASCASDGTPHEEPVRTDYTPSASESFPHCGAGLGSFITDGSAAHHWKVVIDWPASMTRHEQNSPYTNLWCQAGCLNAGDPCSPLRGSMVEELTDKLDAIKPAHTALVVEWA